MTDTTYNGWHNYETWNVHLWLTNEEATYRYWRALAQLCRREAPTAPQVADGIWTPEHDALVERESRTALPPLFQLSRLLIYASAQVVIVWLYLRFGTDGWRDTPMLPFGATAVLLLSLGLGLNARHDPDHPRSPRVAWGWSVGPTAFVKRSRGRASPARRGDWCRRARAPGRRRRGWRG